MRLVFAGTPEAAVPSLRALAASAHDVVGVVTRPDAPLGRRRVLTPSAVATAAAELDLPVLKTERLDDEATSRIREWAPDLGVVVAYGGLVREPLLSDPAHGWINLHFSLLPAWRGAAPVQRALIAGDTQTGVSVFRLVAALDAGDLVAQRSRPMPEQTADEVLRLLAVEGAGVLVEAVDALADGSTSSTPQIGEPTYAEKLVVDDGRLDWHASADEVLARFRGTTPEPGAFTTVAGTRLKILDATLGDPTVTLEPGALVAARDGVHIGTASVPVRVVRVQPAGKAAMAATDWWRGSRLDGAVVGA